MILEMNHVGVFVRDAKKTIDFYSKFLGAKVSFEKEIPDRVHMAYLQMGEGLIEIIEIKDIEKRAEMKFGYDHVCFLTDNVDEDYNTLIQAGSTVLSEPRPASSGNGRLGFLTDPSGLRVELIERDSSFRLPEPVVGDILSFDHISISATDLDAVESFYTSQLFMQPTFKTTVEGLGLTMAHLVKGHQMLELMHTPKSNREPSIGHIALLVDNVDDYVAKLQTLGLEVEAGYPKDAVNGFGRTAKLKGPDNEFIDIVDRKYLPKN